MTRGSGWGSIADRVAASQSPEPAPHQSGAEGWTRDRMEEFLDHEVHGLTRFIGSSVGAG
jgi:hypothetical protein